MVEGITILLYKGASIGFRGTQDNYLRIQSKFPGETNSFVGKISIEKYDNTTSTILQNREVVYKKHLTYKPYLEVAESIKEHAKGIDNFFLGPNSICKKYFKPDTQIFVEETMYYTDPDSGIKFYGTADLILINGDEAILLDYKTSKIEEQKWIDKNNEKYHRQLSLCAKFIKEKFKVSSVKAIIIYTRGLVHEFPSVNEFIIEERLIS